jgi:tripartite-type tricarboxylate transporter receptor subunit TctC
MLRRRLLMSVVALAPLTALAQGIPDRPLKLVVGFPPGTGPDVVGRTLGQKLGELAKQTVVVDNRAGAGGQIAAQTVAKSAPDGTTVLLGEVGSISIAPAAYSKLPYDPAKELVVVSEVVRSDFILVVPAASKATDVRSFIDAAKAGGDRVNFATFGAGTPGHFGAMVLGDLAGFKVEPVHYRATGDAVTALIAGDVQAAFVSTALGVPQIKAGKMRPLATTASTRSPLLPEVPTFAEAGWPKVDFSAWFAVFAPSGTPVAALDTLNRHVVAAMQSPDVRQRLQEAGFTVLGTSRADSERMVKGEAARWASIVKATGFKAD